jgi:Xaa-Pro aminopeptidase
MRLANEIAEMGINYALSKLEPGMTEAQIGALIEYKIRADGPGHKGVRLVRAMAEVGAGPVGSTKGTLLIPSTGYVIQEGDFVMIELATNADGYWSDLTYMAVAGQPNDRQRQAYNILLEAQQAAASQMRHGASFADPDHAARQVLEKAGLEKYFVHITGHGTGFRYHEFVPFLFPGAEGKLEKGMVSSIEPGIYIQDFGGLRIEDNVAVGDTGPVFLSTPRKPW